MSEYWKSTPKYWCKQCSVYVRDTKLEKANHEATGKHQGNLRRFLREIHRENEKEERDKLRAKDEIARLNGAQPGHKHQPPKTSQPKPSPQLATVEERRAQMMQLAAMGVVVPEQYRQSLAMTGEWQTVSERIVSPIKRENTETGPVGVDKSVKSASPISNLKRQAYEADLTDESTGKRPAWGSTIKSLRTSNEDDSELDSLLNGSKLSTDAHISETSQRVQRKSEIDDGGGSKRIKLEDSVTTESNIPHEVSSEHETKADDQEEIIFKKRKKPHRT